MIIAENLTKREANILYSWWNKNTCFNVKIQKTKFRVPYKSLIRFNVIKNES